MGYLATKPIRLQRTVLAELMYLLCLLSLDFVDRGAIAQELVGQAPGRVAVDLTLLTVEQERYVWQTQVRISKSVRTAAR